MPDMKFLTQSVVEAFPSIHMGCLGIDSVQLCIYVTPLSTSKNQARISGQSYAASNNMYT